MILAINKSTWNRICQKKWYDINLINKLNYMCVHSTILFVYIYIIIQKRISSILLSEFFLHRSSVHWYLVIIIVYTLYINFCFFFMLCMQTMFRKSIACVHARMLLFSSFTVPELLCQLKRFCVQHIHVNDNWT